MIIAHNLLADFTGRALGINEKNKGKTAERLSSGYKINRAADNSAGLSISEKMRAQIRGLNRASDNVQEGIDFCNTAEGALHEVHAILGRIRELAVQAANDTNVSADREAINDEIAALKSEINRLSVQTEYNTYKIFVTPCEVEFSDDICAVQIFDANNGDPSDPDSYGGIIVQTPSGQDTRISWTTINPDMVTTGTNGQTVFKAGTYTYDTGLCTLEIECEDGAKPPEVKISFPVEGTDDGINIAGNLIKWKDILDESNESIADHIGEGGIYHFKSGSGTGSFFIKDFSSLKDISDGINECNQRYQRKYSNTYSGYYKAKAVDIQDTGSSLRVTNATVQNNDLDIRLKADKTGIWIVNINADGSDGAEMSNTKRTWQEMGINTWDSGNDISDGKVYHYSTYQTSGYNIKFDFTLLDETSLDSVIAGINNARVYDKNLKLSDAYGLSFNKSGNLESGVMNSQLCNITLNDEIDLGRDFDQQQHSFAQADLTYDPLTNGFGVDFKKAADGSSVVHLVSSNVTTSAVIKNNASRYENNLIARRVQQLLSGQSSPTYPTLEDVIGSANIGKNDLVTLGNSSLNITKNLAGKTGNYPAVKMDFSGLGTNYQLYDLLGTGFNSTCATCDKHYSVVFVYGNTEMTASNGVGYTYSNDGRQNYTLQIDLKSMIEKGINDGATLSNAMVDVMKGCGFDFHYQQYAADGAKFYVCDYRNRELGSFDTKPYEIDKCTIDINMRELNGKGNLGLRYVYNLKNDLDPLAEATADASGLYVKGTTGYVLYNPNDASMQGKQRYNINITNNVASWEAYYDNVMQKIADNSDISLTAKDYAKVGYYTDENPNSATVSAFSFAVYDNKDFWIQSGANTKQAILMEWDTFNAYTLGIGDDTTLTRESSEKLLGHVDKAVEKINGIRSTFGAYTNRMSYAQAVDDISGENLQSSESVLRDADMAEEMVNFSKENILSQAAQSMLAQATSINEGVLSLLNV